MAYTFKPLENAFRTLAWGRGIPSTTLAVMSANGHLEPLDAIIHCDPGWEHYETYELGDFYTTWLRRHDIHVEILDTGDIREQGAAEHIHIPFWVATGGQLRRQCTRHFKIAPHRRRLRELLGYHPSKPPAPPPNSVEQWIGFTFDELERMKDHNPQYVVTRWPLIEKRMTRRDCANYLLDHGLPLPPPSSCIGCPYKSPDRWTATTPNELAQAIEFDELNRHNPLAKRAKSTADKLYVYKHLRVEPLATANFAADTKTQSSQQLLLPCGGDCWT